MDIKAFKLLVLGKKIQSQTELQEKIKSGFYVMHLIAWDFSSLSWAHVWDRL